MKKLKKMFGQIDLTSGSPGKVLLFFTIPLLIYQILNSSFSLINALVLKNTVGGDSVAAINSTISISLLLFQFAYGCSNGFAILIAENFGNKDLKKLKKVFYNGLYLCLALAVFISSIGLIFYKDLLVFLNIDQIYMDKASQYFQIMLIGFVFILLSNYLANVLRALGDSFAPLVIVIVTVLTNIIMAILLTGVIKLDTKGVAIATLIANAVTVLITYIYINKKYSYFKIENRLEKANLDICLNMLKVGLPLGFQWSILFLGSFFQSRTINSFGNGLATKAASCYSNFESYLQIIYSSISVALLNYVGQNYGKRDLMRIKKGIKGTLIVNTIIWLVLFATSFLFIDYVPYIFLPKNELIDSINGEKIIFYCSTYLKTIISLYFLQGYLVIFRSVLQGIQKTLIPFLAGVGELLGRILICFIIPSLINPNNPISDESYVGVCFATPTAWFISFAIMGIGVIYFIYRRNDKMINSTKIV